MHLEVVRYRQRLDSLFKKGASLTNDLELQAQWARYLCILASGYLEFSVRRIYSDYVEKRAEPGIARYVNRQLNDFQNAKMEKIYQLAGAFSSDWEKTLRTETEGQLRDAVDSIVANRHRIAHGDDVTITFIAVKQYYEGAQKVISLIDNLCNPREQNR